MSSTTNQHIQLGLAVSALALAMGLVISKKMKMKKNGELLKKLIPFITRWEGGLSRATTDTASHNPAPWSYSGKTGWHTNKGITYSTFVSLAKKIGYAITPSNFFTMPDSLWFKILQSGYMKAYPLHLINHLPRVQAVIITWAWGSGTAGSERRLANFQRQVMGIRDSNITKSEIVNNFLTRISPRNELKWFQALCDRREADFRRMSTFAANGRGWLRRLADFRITFA
jgi:lysozyme family protein